MVLQKVQEKLETTAELNLKRNTRIMCVGMNFDSRGGFLSLPENNGEIRFFNHEKTRTMIMTTSCNPIPYQHPVTFASTYNNCINAGWIQWFQYTGDLAAFKICTVKAYECNLDATNLQVDYFRARYRNQELQLNTVQTMFND